MLQDVKRGYKGLQGVTGSYKSLGGDTRGYSGVTRRYKGLQRVTRGYRWLQGIREGYKRKRLQGGYKSLKGVTRRPVPIVLGNFWATFGVWSNFLQFWQPRANFAFLSNFWAKYRFGAQIKNEKVNDFIENFNSCEFLECLSNFFKYIFLKLKIATFPAILI